MLFRAERPPRRAGRVAFVTGASSGLGRGLAEGLAENDWSVALAARREAELESVAGRIRERGGTALALPCDVSHREQVLAAVRRAEGELGALDLLVANAGISGDTPARDLDGREVERVFQVNVLGMVYAVEAVLPGMLHRGRGHLVGMSSIAGFRGLPRRPAYSASKAAMTAFLEGLRVDLRGSGVDVTVVSPGWVKTPLTARNPHAMPFLLELDEAVAVILRGLERRRRHVTFPWPVAALARLLRFLPPSLYDRCLSRGARHLRAD